MSKVWKWVIGILIALVVLAIVVAIPVGMHYFGMRYYAQFPQQGLQQGSQNPQQGYPRGDGRSFGPGMMGPYRGEGYNHYGMMGRGSGFYGPMMMRGFGFFPFGGIFTGLIGLAVLGLAIYGVVALFNRHPAPAPAVAATEPPVAKATCSNCGKLVQGDWKNCPYCGNALVS